MALFLLVSASLDSRAESNHFFMRGFKYQSHNLIVLGVIIVFYKAYSLFKRFSFLLSLYAFCALLHF